MTRERRRRGATGAGTVLLVALGAMAGLAIGMAIADRSGGLEGLLRGQRKRQPRRPRDDGERGAEGYPPRFDEWADDDPELAPEAISHLQLRGRDPEAPARSPGVPASGGMPKSTAMPSTEAPRASAAELEGRVLEVFRNDPVLAGLNIDIEADELGHVELTGWVDEPSQIGHALRRVRGVPQVRGVTHQLAVQPGTVG